MKRVSLFDLNIACVDNQQFETVFKKALSGNKIFKIAKVNAEFLQRAMENNEFKETLQKMDLLLPDGVGVQWSAKFFSIKLTKIPILRELEALFQAVFSLASLVIYPKYCMSPIIHRYPGIEAFYQMLKIAEETGKKVYILGSEQKTLEHVIPKLKKEFKELNIVGYNEGWQFDNAKIINEINTAEAELLFVALGSPKQEFWIRENESKFQTVKVVVGEGGTLDRIADEHKLAPKWVNTLGLEWVWRGLFNKGKTLKADSQTETSSRLSRVLKAVPLFIWQTFNYKVRNAK